MTWTETPMGSSLGQSSPLSSTTPRLQKGGVDAQGLVESVHHHQFFANQDSVSFSSILELLLELRGANTTRVKDLVDLRRYMAASLLRLERRMDSLARQTSLPDTGPAPRTCEAT